LLDNPPATTLQIDTKALAARAAAEQLKLRRMLDYCYHKTCLRRFILGYFGDRKKVERCDSCSNCAPNLSIEVETSRSRKSHGGSGVMSIAASAPAGHRPATEIDTLIIDNAPTGNELRSELRKRAALNRAVTETTPEPEPLRGRSLNAAEIVVVRKILSCVARMNGRFGKGTVAAVLRGSKSSQVAEHKLDRLSTYGLLRDMTQDDIGLQIKALIQAGCIAAGKGVYPTVSLTDFGREVMAARAEVLLDLP
jgi:superfamily II DNA helicase RecQ